MKSDGRPINLWNGRRKKAGDTRVLLRITVYCLKILARWFYG
jgi:hypothetical protein